LHPGIAASVITACLLIAGEAQGTIRFVCPNRIQALAVDLDAYRAELQIDRRHIRQTLDRASGTITLALDGFADQTGTLELHRRGDLALGQEIVRLPTKRGLERRQLTVSRKEIMFALLQQGRVTEFRGEDCSLQALQDDVGIRQNLVGWAERLSWGWPNGKRARWNPRYWSNGTPVAGVTLADALLDAFLQQDRYAIGCYTAAKLIVAHAFIDYYQRVRPDPVRLQRVIARLQSDGEPLYDIEPDQMWSFERDFDSVKGSHPGKLLALQASVPSDNFVPGDWVYLLNTDAASAEKTGYEGSNAIYLGGGRFDDFYNDHGHSFTYAEKLEEVYQWRFGVFNRVRDRAKRHSLSPDDRARLSQAPEDGGLQMQFRAVPRRF
jgi:hypothetical protein